MIHVLYVDDEESLLQLGKLFLERSGQFSVDIVPSAAEALRRLTARSYDAIISDYQMPEIDGIEFLKRVRGSGNTIPFILFTGKGREEIVIQALNEGADFYLQKGGAPLAQFTELAFKVRHAVQKRWAEARLRDHERREADIINFLPDPTFAIDRSGTIIAWNRAVTEMTGVRPGEILGKNQYEHALAFYSERRPMLADLILSPDPGFEKTNYLSTQHNGRTLTGEAAFLRKDGTKVHLWGKASLLLDENGVVTGAIESVRDITEQKRAETELRAAYEQLAAVEEELRNKYNELARSERLIRESGEKYRDLVETANSIIMKWDKTGTITFVNDYAEKFFGYLRGEMIGKPLIGTIVPVTESGSSKDLRLLIEDIIRHPVNYAVNENENITRDGRRVWIQWQNKPIFDGDGAFTGILSVGTDLTERRRIEEELFNSQQMLRIVLDSIPQRVFWKDKNSVFLGSNAHLAHDAGYSDPAALVGKTDYDTATKTTAEQYRADDRFVMETGIPKINYEEPQVRPDGSRAWLQTSKIPLRNKKGEVFGVLGTYEDITDRKLAEEKLRESDAKFRAIFDSTFQFAGLLTTEGILIEINRTALDFVGADPGDVLNRPFWETAWWQGDEARVQRLKDAVREAAKGKFVRYEEEIVGKEKCRMVVDFSLKPVSDSEGRIRFLIPEARDITEIKREERALYENKQYLSSIFDTVSDIMFQLTVESDGNLRLTSINRAFTRITGLSPDQLVGKTIDEITPRETLSLTREKYRQAIEDKAIVRWEITSVHLPEQLTGEISVAPIFDRDGHCTHLIGVVHDITERKKTEVMLREGEAKYRGIFAAESDGIAVVDRKEGTIIDCNDAMSLMHGYPKEELVGMPLTSLSAESEATHAAITEATHTIRDRFHKRKDGSVFPVEIMVSATTLQGRDVLIGAIRDVTGARKTDEALLRANRQLALLTNVTRHDINNQLIALNGFVDLLREKASNPSLEDYFTWISQVSTRISSMIQFASTYETIQKTHPEWQDIRALTTTAVHLVSPGNVTVKNEIPPGMEILADPLLVKVLYNLVENAVRYGNTITEIRFYLRDQDNQRVIVCEDDGVGILPENKEMIFDRGFGKNTGLGLFLAREILSLTGMTIRETGEPGKGARFEITMPKGTYRFTGNP